ncbi:T9SS type A sorting domain-containing protein [Pontibacter rugosus]|uniref:T9SS type A sorting domain-containing protein n=2 Tax=Pontibacter rugosus TaxID=1745966 RepID=A0ABW3SJH3_9BACT
MKLYILTLTFTLCMLQIAAAKTSQLAGCMQENNCLKIEYLGAKIAANKATLSFKVTAKCKFELSHASFELTPGTKVTAPAASNGKFEYKIETGKNKGYPGFYSIKYEATNAKGYSNGVYDTFSYTIPLDDFESMSTIRAEAKAGKEQLVVSFDANGCRPATGCMVDVTDAAFRFTGATPRANGTTEVIFQVQNNLLTAVNSITIETPTAAGNISVANANKDNYSANFKYNVSIDQEADLITFYARNATAYADGAADNFAIIIPTEAYEQAPYFQLQMASGSTILNTGFNTQTCDDSPIKTLPVELVAFKGKATASGIALEWSTASEKDNDYFEVQHSADGESFSAIGRVQGVGNSSNSLSYTFTDTRPKAGVNYYRLEQVDFDGQSQESKVIAVEVRKSVANNQMQVYPNPAINNYVRIAMQNSSKSILQIMDVNGRQIYHQEIQQGAQELEVSIADLRIPKGLYYINLQGENGRQTQKLIVQ